MKRKMTFLAVASTVLALSTVVSAAAEPSTTDAQTQAGGLLTAHTQFHNTQPIAWAGADTDAQSQARAIVGGEPSRKPAHTVANNRAVPLPATQGTKLAHRSVHGNADAQSMAATVLLGSGA